MPMQNSSDGTEAAPSELIGARPIVKCNTTFAENCVYSRRKICHEYQQDQYEPPANSPSTHWTREEPTSGMKSPESAGETHSSRLNDVCEVRSGTIITMVDEKVKTFKWVVLLEIGVHRPSWVIQSFTGKNTGGISCCFVAVMNPPRKKVRRLLWSPSTFNQDIAAVLASPNNF
ncbi:hypothetical protein CC1G_14415 [Coprinopsis cinerea okayama7|uniref:Uncharacterized protein n=1 Tax=Coprinopsis cinerea (strain Okayama-7 / 130 / ATCC MYA-4618 / FGSC 9003) TaxID=240176 RepID=D6RM26_COPC7|nr:hypothetical protein CC1G_14415 [Coprinopsis cinerea okayama7\|eukprot:XP_002911418.1 hypothetical protein CC1G_14415 [Coprinopsis cinerea okayama7\